jgi:hypothetical protein
MLSSLVITFFVVLCVVVEFGKWISACDLLFGNKNCVSDVGNAFVSLKSPIARSGLSLRVICEPK